MAATGYLGRRRALQLDLLVKALTEYTSGLVVPPNRYSPITVLKFILALPRVMKTSLYSSHTHIKESCPMLLVEPWVEEAKRGTATEESMFIYQGQQSPKHWRRGLQR